MIFPYGNGAEKPLENKNIGAFISGWNFNMHDRKHFFRTAQEGIVFGLNYGLQIMRDMGTEIKTVRAGKANMFLSPVFSKVFAYAASQIKKAVEITKELVADIKKLTLPRCYRGRV